MRTLQLALVSVAAICYLTFHVAAAVRAGEDGQLSAGESNPSQKPVGGRWPVPRRGKYENKLQLVNNTLKWVPMLSAPSKLKQGWDNCFTTDMRYSCSGHGSCVAPTAYIFGIARETGKKHCRCDAGFWGKACQLEMKADAKATLQSQLEGWNAKAPLRKDLPNTIPAEARRAFFANLYTSAKSNSSLNLTAGAAAVRHKLCDEPPAASGLDDWADPSVAQLLPTTRAEAQFVHDRLATPSLWALRKQQRRAQKAAAAPAVARVLTNKVFELATKGNFSDAKFAIYTSQEGRSVVLPTIYQGQRGFPDRDRPIPSVRDPGEDKLLAVLNAAAKMTAAWSRA